MGTGKQGVSKNSELRERLKANLKNKVTTVFLRGKGQTFFVRLKTKENFSKLRMGWSR